MPEANYAVRPVDTVRTFGQMLAHVAGANYVFCAAARGEKAPYAEDAFEKSATTRAAIIQALEGSLAYCDAAYTALTDRSAGEMVEGPFGSGRTARAAALTGNTGHLQEHYGNLVTYLRISGPGATFVRAAAVARRVRPRACCRSDPTALARPLAARLPPPLTSEKRKNRIRLGMESLLRVQQRHGQAWCAPRSNLADQGVRPKGHDRSSLIRLSVTSGTSAVPVPSRYPRP
jgi:hypothetical protein